MAFKVIGTPKDWDRAQVTGDYSTLSAAERAEALIKGSDSFDCVQLRGSRIMRQQERNAAGEWETTIDR